MRIAIDISAVIYGTGVSVYTKNLTRQLSEIDDKNNYVLYGGSLRRKNELKDFASWFEDKKNFESKIITLPPTLADIVWNRLCTFPIEWILGEVDVLHSSDWAQPPGRAFKVTTIHDLVPIKYPELSHPRIVSAHKARLERVKRNADRVIVPSSATAKDAVREGIAEKKIRVIPEAPDPIFKPVSDKKINNLKKKLNINGEYLLAVGVNPRKNTKRIIKAYKSLKKKAKLVFVGEPFVETGKEKNILFLGHVPESQMPILFSGAEALVYPSLYEGFGLPILEAFSCKIPVITSNRGSMREVAGNAAVLVEPESVGSIADGIKKALDNRESLVKKGVKRIKKYSWKKSAEKTLSVYTEPERDNYK